MFDFSKEQNRAITHLDGPALVLAGPGSGKTAVITNRVCSLLFSAGIAPEKILVITYTRAAAEEMRKRYASILRKEGRSVPLVMFGTFHSLFLWMLRQEYPNAHLRVINEKEAMQIVASLLQEQQPEMERDQEYIAYLYHAVMRYKVSGFKVFPHQIERPLFLSLYRKYQERLRNEGKLDFEDILLMALDMLQEKQEILSRYQERFSHLLIDEFQDINPIQFSLIRLLCEKHHNLFVVGDDDQSIYGFRGSNPELMRSFSQIYPETKLYYLSKNYRSMRSVVNAAETLISRNRTRFSKDITASHFSMGKVSYLIFSDLRDEAKGIQKLAAHFREQGVSYQDMAVLTRGRRELAMLSGLIREQGPQHFYTYHGAKGLEFRIVFLPCLNEGIVPKRDPAHNNLEEERRVFYVALTRAKEQVVLSRFRFRSRRKQEASRFLSELGI